MFWFIFGIVAVSFTLGAIVGYKFYEMKDRANYSADWKENH